MAKQETITIRVLTNLGKYKEGQLVRVFVGKSGQPKDQFWRKRLRDAAKDGCCEIVKPEKKKSQSKKKTESQSSDNA